MIGPKVGMIFECGPAGADKAVCEYLVSQLRPGVSVKSQTLDNKPNLLANGAKVAAALLADGCERVLIVWDLRPAWPDTKKKACRAAECKAILGELDKENLVDKPVFLICIEQELESWLLADKAQLAEYLSTAAHAYKVNGVKKPDRVMQPKSAVLKHFKNARGWDYEDRVHAVKVIRSVKLNLARLRQSESFARFETKLTFRV